MGGFKRFTRAARSSTITDLSLLQRRLKVFAEQPHRSELERRRIAEARNHVVNAILVLQMVAPEREPKPKRIEKPWRTST